MICHVWPWNLTYQNFFCAFLARVKTYTHTKTKHVHLLVLIWKRLQTPTTTTTTTTTPDTTVQPLGRHIANKIESGGLWKRPYDHWLTKKCYHNNKHFWELDRPTHRCRKTAGVGMERSSYVTVTLFRILSTCKQNVLRHEKFNEREFQGFRRTETSDCEIQIVGPYWHVDLLAFTKQCPL